MYVVGHDSISQQFVVFPIESVDLTSDDAGDFRVSQPAGTLSQATIKPGIKTGKPFFLHFVQFTLLW
jgi:hypothetical protein